MESHVVVASMTVALVGTSESPSDESCVLSRLLTRRSTIPRKICTLAESARQDVTWPVRSEPVAAPAVTAITSAATASSRNGVQRRMAAPEGDGTRTRGVGGGSRAVCHPRACHPRAAGEGAAPLTRCARSGVTGPYVGGGTDVELRPTPKSLSPPSRRRGGRPPHSLRSFGGDRAPIYVRARGSSFDYAQDRRRGP